jgi:DNA-binding CsgD family transcriptional regulator
MARFGRFAGSDMTVLERLDKRNGKMDLVYSDRPDVIADVREAYETYYYRLSPRWDVGLSLPPGALIHDDLIGDEKALGRSEFYVDFLLPTGLKYFAGMAVSDDAEQSTVLSLQYAPDRGRIDTVRRSLLDQLLPDLSNAIGLSQRIAHRPADDLAALFDGLADPVAVITADARLVAANAAMRLLLERGGVIRLYRGCLAGTSTEIDRAMAAALRIAASERSAAVPCLHPGSGRLIFRATALHDQGAAFGSGGPARFCLVIDDPTRPDWREIETAMAIFGLTRREAQVGLHLAAGLTIDEASARLAISRNTVRSHLAMLRDKLGVRSALAVAAEMRRAREIFLG